MTDATTFGPLDAAFSRALAPWVGATGPVGVLFSGGVDSGLLAWELRHRPGLVLSTVGTPSSPDLRAARGAAGIVGVRWVPSEVTVSDVRALPRPVRAECADLPRTARSVLTAFALALQKSPSGVVLCGQGADELFLGYAHYRGLDAASARERSEADLRQLQERDWLRSQRIAHHLERVVTAPYLEPEFVRAARDVPIERRMPVPVPKAFFREWAVHRGLPAEIALRPKRALQFGSGIDKLLPHPAGGARPER
ncbi:MAG: asparagine synthase-related protein [Thermoplasmata archaeon]